MIVVTGGAGFIGSHLVDALISAGESVRVLEHPSACVKHLPQAAEIVRVDIRDQTAVSKALAGCRQVYHLAANPNLWTRRRADFDAVNHQGTRHVLEAALAQGAERIVHVSTESILTSRSFRGGAVESLRPRASDMVGTYCLSKLRAEEVAWRLADAGAPVLVASPTLPIGPGDRGMSPPTRMTVAAARGKLPAFLQTQFNMMDARDMADGLLRVMERGIVGRRYLLGAYNLKLSEWLELIATAAGVKPPKYEVPYWLALAAGYTSEWWADWVGGQMPQATVTGVKLTRYCMHFDASATLAELELQPRPLAESVADAVAWYRQQGWI